MYKAQTVIFTATVFLSAYLLFVVQPMIGKVMLPSLGGTPMVWNTTMLFFQILLLGGYLYAHVISKISVTKWQFALHTLALLAAGLVTLPMPTAITPPDDIGNPLWWQITMMMGAIGLPFLFLSATAPLLQKWFSQTSHPDASNPYFLYASSNVGSVLALLLYPVVVEQIFPLADQSRLWAIGFYILLALITGSAITALKYLTPCSANPPKEETTDIPSVRVPPRTLATWVFLAFVPSSLMIGYTSYITTDIGSLPLFWVIPLTLYILSFVVAFAKRQPLPLSASRTIYVIATSLIVALMSCTFFLKLELGIALGIWFFITAIMCHQELSSRKPDTKHLTLFYLAMSVGGAMGGIFNALIAPIIFTKAHEFSIVVALSLLCWNFGAAFSWKDDPRKIKTLGITALGVLLAGTALYIQQYAFDSGLILSLPLIGVITAAVLISLMDRRPFYIGLSMLLMLATPLIPWSLKSNLVDISRNYYGTLITMDSKGLRLLSHGTTLHGAQPLDPNYKTIPLTYYNEKTAIGEAFRVAQSKHKNLNIGGLGLGTGSISCLLRKDDDLTFFEIDPDIIRIATNPQIFSYLNDCHPETAIIEGDARLKIKTIADKTYDVILVDVFSSDNVPMHLITEESTRLYLSKLKDDGILVFHLSSRYFNLQPEVGAIARALDVPSISKISKAGDIAGTAYSYSGTDVTVLTRNQYYLDRLTANGWAPTKAGTQHPWTDAYANPLRAMKLIYKSESSK